MNTGCQLSSALLVLIIMVVSGFASADDVPTGVVFHHETHRHLHYDGADGHGDNWCQTRASDGNMYAFADDGFGWNPSRPKKYTSFR